MIPELTDAEQHLIALVRHEDSQNFTFELTADNGRWDIKLSDHDSGINGDGHGATFERYRRSAASNSVSFGLPGKTNWLR